MWRGDDDHYYVDDDDDEASLKLIIRKGNLLLLLQLKTTMMMIMTGLLCKMCDMYGQAFTIPNCRNVYGTYRRLLPSRPNMTRTCAIYHIWSDRASQVALFMFILFSCFHIEHLVSYRVARVPLFVLVVA